MGYSANVIVGQAQSWIGLKESDNSFLEILKVYNDMPKTHSIPLPRGHKMVKTDSWCACFTSACALAVNYHDIIPVECSCTKVIAKAKDMGIWVEDESVTPKVGWLILYDWDDKSGKSDNTGGVEHIGIIEKVEGGKITVIEGNYSNAVKRRVLDVNGKYIRGYVAPKYDDDTSGSIECEQVGIKLTELSKGSEGKQVKTVQRILKDMGYDLGRYGVDGDFGPMTEKAVKAFQKTEKLEVDGIVGINTWTNLLKG